MASQVIRQINLAMRSLPRGICIWLAGVVIWLTLAPFSPRPEPAVIHLGLSDNVTEIIGNFVLFAPIAAVLAAAARQGGVLWPAVRIAGIIALLSTAVELAQLFVAGRIISPWDVTLNTTGAAVAAAATLGLCSRGVGRRPIVAAVGAVILAAVLAHMIGSAIAADERFRLARWNPQFAIVSGDEVGGDRTYEGQVLHARICAGIASRRVCANDDSGRRERQLLASRAMQSQHIALHAVVWAQHDHQVGPARIVTFSAGTSCRNVTLAQSGRSLLLRIRTPLSGPNGTGFEFRVPEAVDVESPTAVVATFDEGRVRIRAASPTGATTAGFELDVLNAWIIAHPIQHVEQRDLLLATATGAWVLFVPIGLLVGWLLSRRKLAGFLVAPIAAVTAMILLCALQAALDSLPALMDLSMAATAAVLGALLTTMAGGGEFVAPAQQVAYPRDRVARPSGAPIA